MSLFSHMGNSFLWIFIIFENSTNMVNNRMKILFVFAGMLCLLTSCSSSKPVSSGTTVSTTSHSNSSVKFLDKISINGHKEPAKYSGQNASNGKINSGEKTVPAAKMESYSDLQFKYAILENAPVEEMKNIRLLEFMEEWY